MKILQKHYMSMYFLPARREDRSTVQFPQLWSWRKQIRKEWNRYCRILRRSPEHKMTSVFFFSLFRTKTENADHLFFPGKRVFAVRALLLATGLVQDVLALHVHQVIILRVVGSARKISKLKLPLTWTSPELLQGGARGDIFIQCPSIPFRSASELTRHWFL